MPPQSSTQALQQRHMPNSLTETGHLQADWGPEISENGQPPEQNRPLSEPAQQVSLDGQNVPSLPCLPRREYSDIADDAESGPWSRKTVLSFGM
jgi:hypothetical protein